MSLQYIRKVSIVVGNDSGQRIDFSDFKVTFYIQRGDIQTPNSADVRIYNLSDQTAAKLASPESTQLVIQGGYEGNFGLLFTGQIKQVRLGRVDAKDSYVDITAADGDSAYNFSTLAISLKAGQTAPKDVIQSLIKGMGGLGTGYLPQLSSQPLPRGEVYYGLTRDALRKFSKSNDCLWSIQDGQIVLIPQTAYRPGAVVPLITPETGLIGVPEQTANGLQVRVLINPSLKIGQCFKLDSVINQARLGLDIQSQAVNSQLSKTTLKTNADGLYYVMRADHHGDTRGNEYYTDLTCLAVDATQPANTQIYGAINPEVASIKRY